jgi:CHAT domain-containing protein
MQTVFEALQNNFCFDDLRGNFVLAQTLADQNSAEAQTIDDPSVKANAHYWQGVVGFARGNMTDVFTHFEIFQKAFPNDANAKLLALEWQIRLAYAQYAKAPDGGGQSYSLEIALRQNLMAVQQKYFSDKQTIQFDAQPMYQNLARLLEFYRIISQHYNLAQGTFLNGQIAQGIEQNSVEASSKYYCTALHTEGVNLQNGQICGWAYWLLADLFARSGEREKAMQSLNSARENYTHYGDTHGLALCAMLEGDWAIAPFSGVAAMNMYLPEIESVQNSVTWFIAKNEGDTEGVNKAAAETHFQIAHQMAASLDAPRLKAALHMRFAYLAFLKKEWDKALAFIEKAIIEAQACGDTCLAQTAAAHKIIYLIAADKTATVMALATAIGAWGKVSGSFSWALSLGQLLCRYGRYWFAETADTVQAIRAARAAQNLFTALEAKANFGQAVADEANVYYRTGDTASAFNLWQQLHPMLESYRADKPEDIAQRLFMRQAQIESDLMNNFSAARDTNALRRIINQVASLLPPDAAQITMDDIIQALSKGDHIRGSELSANYTRCMVLSSARVQAPLLEAKNARVEGDTKRAKQLYAEALTAVKDCPPSFRYMQEATIHAHLKDYDTAVRIYDQHIDWLKQPNNSGARISFQNTENPTAVAEGRLGLIREFIQHVSMFTRCRAYNRAEAMLHELEKIGGDDWFMVEEMPYKPLSDVGWLYEGLKNYNQALHYYRKAIAQFEGIRQKLTGDAAKVSFAGDSAAGFLFFQTARCALMSANNTMPPEQAAALSFQFAEQGKARALLDLLANTANQKTNSPSLSLWRQLGAQVSAQKTLLAHARNEPQTTPQMIQSLETKIRNLEAEYALVEEKMVVENPRFYELIRRDAPVLDTEAVFDKLPPRSVFISYMFYDDDFMAWCLTADRQMRSHHRQNLNIADLNRQIQKLYTLCCQMRDPSVLAAELADIFIAPFAAEIQAAERIILSPFGAANRLPFQILPMNGLPLGLNYDLSYLPNASLLAFLDTEKAADTSLSTKKSPVDSIFAIGNPANMSYRENPLQDIHTAENLPAAEAEARFVAQLFQQNICLTGEMATEEAFNRHAPHADILHLATHGIAADSAPLNSAILLAHGKSITVDELIGLNIKARLVTLSACETALGATTEGGDVLGLSRGVLAAGAKAVVVSLWKVNDMMTSVLMKTFYTAISKGHSPARAMRLAQKHIYESDWSSLTAEAARSARGIGKAYQPEAQMEKGRLPYFWAAFMVISA